jgi:phosphoribosyl 1,2-cyclic phosphodiesterase
MELFSIASGSSGNCYYVGNDNTHLLVDVGISCKKVEKALSEYGLKPSELDGVLVTHEHIDHVKGIGVLSRKYQVPIYATAKTIHEMKNMSQLGDIDSCLFHEVCPDEQIEIQDITVDPTSIWHDAADPVCYSMYGDGKKISIATDMGNFNDYITDKLDNSDIMVVEANHDVKMLEAGTYPYYLKRRILGNYGHLSNERSGQLIKSLLNDHIKGILLGHLSKENNFEELAYETVKLELMENSFTADVREFGLSVAKRDEPGQVIKA